MDHRNIRGKIQYIGGNDEERGREWFSMTFHEDGQRTLRAHCEIDDTEVLRETVYTMDENWRPLDCFNRLHVERKFLGTGWVRAFGNEAECEVYNTTLGRVSQTVSMDGPAKSLTVHPLTCDVFHCAGYDHDNSENPQTLNNVLSTSPMPNGASGPFLSVGKVTVMYDGREEITVPAGTFEVDHYHFVLKPQPDGTPRREDVWCIPEDYTFVKVTVDGFLKNSRYELVEYETEF
ncbi:MAG: hypothetical protein HOH20_09170 [Rhodospirillaceae bacterium]|jgi:hypothetical protein|nr:hypothetical protein [Rhodospirillaceae bacterium]MBT5564442.1 hypothetical protein [Rhodospirillaceae bacterium]MBT6089733.1 hypothetical protein [Rhodospirillaceae bacterium]